MWMLMSNTRIPPSLTQEKKSGCGFYSAKLRLIKFYETGKGFTSAYRNKTDVTKPLIAPENISTFVVCFKRQIKKELQCQKVI